MRWRALALFLLAPLMGEALSGSTPPIAFLNPVVFVFQAGLYGSGAVLAREWVRGRGLGWRSLLLVGAAYGVWEEAIMVTSWYNPVWPDLLPISAVSRAAGINWTWALALTMFHMTISVTTPVVLLEAAFRDTGRRWTRNRTLWLLALLMLAVTGFGLYGFGFHNFASKGYAHPPGSYLVGVVVFAVLLFLGLRSRRAAVAVAVAGGLPNLWVLRALAFGAGVAWFIGLWILPRWFPRAGIIPVAWLTLLLVVAWWRVSTWSRRPGWGRAQVLALAAGATAFMIAITPISELAGKFGSVALGLLMLAFLVWLSMRRYGSSEAERGPAAPVSPVPAQL